jgi:hypothetical protein
LLISAAYSNIALLSDSAEVYASQAPMRRAELGALDVARSEIPEVGGEALDDPGPLFSGLIWAGSEVGADAAERRVGAAPYYFEIEDSFGTPAASPEELRSLAEPLREQADQVLAAAVPLTLERAASRPSSARAPVVESLDGNARVRRGCLILEPREDLVAATVSVPPGSVWIEGAGKQPPELTVGRLADVPSVALGWTTPGETASLSLPAMRLGEQPWRLRVESRGVVTICDPASG